MKILLLHNHYQSSSPSGEDVAVENDRLLLEAAGHQVLTYSRHNDSIAPSIRSRIQAARTLFWSREAYRDISRLLVAEQPDIAHFHNTFPLISVSGYRACRTHGVPIVQTLHNYRLICPGALLMRSGRPCEQCIDHSLLSSVQHACYRNSRVGTALVASMLAVNRRRRVYTKDVDRYICLTRFAVERFVRAGFPSRLLIVRPNGLLNPPNAGHGEGRFALYVGRLSKEKGVETLIRAWQDIDYPLRIVGEGPLRTSLEQLARSLQVSVIFEGFRTRSEVHAFMQDATLMVTPSEWYEGFPVVTLEGLAAGTPMVVSALGALDEIIDSPANGLKFNPGDPVSLRQAVVALLGNPAALSAMRLSNRKLFEEQYSPQSAVRSLESIYQTLRVDRRSGDNGTPTVGQEC